MITEEGKTHWTDQELETLRNMVRELMLNLGLSQAAAARDADVPGSTFSQFLNAKYEGDNDAVAKKLAAWVRTRKEEERLASTAPPEPPFVLTKTAETVLGVLRAAQALQDIGVVTGPPGCGKTWAARHYASNTSRVVIVTASPSIATAGAIMQRMLAARNETPRGRSAASKLELTTHARRIFTLGWLLIVDEAQHLNMDALEELRAIHDETGAGVVLMGNETVLSRIEGNQRSASFAQLYSRAGVRAKLKEAPPEDIDLVLTVMGVAHPNLNPIAHQIGAKDSLRVVVKATRRAMMIATGSREELAGDHLRVAYRQLGGLMAR